MEPLTHTLVGAVVARSRLGRSTPLAGAALLAGANLPDVDVLSYLAGADAALGFRRGWTHGPAALVILPVLLAALLVGVDRIRARRDPSGARARPAVLFGLSWLACLTHPALDWLNTYGIRLLMPFDDRWFYGDTLFIVDPYVWLLLGGGTFLRRGTARVGVGWFALVTFTSAIVLLGRASLPSATPWIWLFGVTTIVLLERGRRRARVPARIARVAGAALPLTVIYIVTLLTLSSLGQSWVRARLPDRGVRDATHVMVAPTPANPLRWEIVAETPAAYHRGVLSWWPERRLVLDPRPTARPPDTPIVRAALRAPQIAGAVGWMRFPYIEIEPLGDGWTVRVIDARYVPRARVARSAGSRFGVAVVELDRNLQPVP